MKVYIYSVLLISLLVILFSAIVLLDRALKIWVFPLGDQPNYSYPCMNALPGEAKPIRCTLAAAIAQRTLDQEAHAAQSNSLPAIIVMTIAVPVWWVHWWLAKKLPGSEGL